MQSYPTGLTHYPQDLLTHPHTSTAPSVNAPQTPAPSHPDTLAATKSRQQRVTRACDACRKRKVRCDGSGGGPAESNQGGVAEVPCTLCQQQGIPCTFEQRVAKRPPSKSYVDTLERRLEAMESLLTSLSGHPNPAASSSSSSSSSAAAAAAAALASTSSASTSTSPSTSLPTPLHAAVASGGGPVLTQPGPSSMHGGGGGGGGGGAEGTENGIGIAREVPERPPSPPQTGLDAIQRLGERLDDLVIETDRYVGRGSGLHLVYSVHEHLSLDHSPAKDGPSLVDNLLHAEHIRFQQSIEMPPEDLAERLVERAFEELQPWPLVVKEDFMEGVRRGMVESNRGFRALYFAICALGSRFVSDPRLDPPPSASACLASLPPLPGPGPSNTNRATNYLDPNQLRIARGYQYFWASCTAASTPLVSATLYDIQADVVSILWLLGSTGMITAWTAIGFAIRRAIDVGAHREGRTRWNTSPLQDQQRKRAFHALLSLDRFISSMLGRPLSIQEADFDVDVPLSITDDELVSWDRAVRLARARGLSPPGPPRSVLEDAFARPPGAAEDSPPSEKPHYTIWSCAVELHSIMGQALSLLYGLKRDKSQRKMVESVCELDSRLNRWLEMIPPILTWHPSKMLDSQLLSSAWLHCAYYQCQILVHREFISPSRSRALGFPSLAICSNAARSCARVLDILGQRKLLESSYSWAPVTAVTSGLMLILGVFANPTGPPGSPPATLTPSALADVQRCLKALEYLSPSSFMAMKCFDGFSRMAVLVAPGALSNLAGASSSSSQNTPGGSVGTPVGTGCYAGVSPTTTTTTTTAPRNPLTSSLKRANPDGAGQGGEGDSPGSTMSLSDKPSPADSTGAVAAAAAAAPDGSGAYKARKVAGLPFSTHDLSSSTFNGRPTFASPGRSSTANGATAATTTAGTTSGAYPPQGGMYYGMSQQQPSNPFQQQQPQQQQQQSAAQQSVYPPTSSTLPPPFFDFTDPASAGGLAEFDFSAFTDLPGFPTSFSPSTSTSFSSGFGGGAAPPPPPPPPSSFGTAAQPPLSTAAPSAPGPAQAGEAFHLADFWNLPFDEPGSVPPAVGQGFADLMMTNFGMQDASAAAGQGHGLGGTAGSSSAVPGGYDPALFAGFSPFASHPPASGT
ncbi:hypothetical protein JCM11251_005003 [Rhodosporidiobolus azoricus]